MRGSDLRRATIFEVLRARTVIDSIGRRVRAPEFRPWRVADPHHRTVFVRIADCTRSGNLPHPERFDPYRFDRTRAPSRRHQHGSRSVAEHGVHRRVRDHRDGYRAATVLQNFRIQSDAAADRSRFLGRAPRSSAAT